jgi:hypothetical protein
MRPILSRTLALAPHPASPLGAVKAIEVAVTHDPGGRLTLAYTLEADAARLRIPPPRAPRRAAGLWRHTCFEAFIAPASGDCYLELNFSPSGEWARYEFSAYRERRPEPVADRGAAEMPRITIAPGAGTLTLEATVDLPCLSGKASAKMALAVVVEDSDGALSYWALRHAPGRPDFHHPLGFALQL